MHRSTITITTWGLPYTAKLWDRDSNSIIVLLLLVTGERDASSKRYNRRNTKYRTMDMN
jgi:hypothetical protein